MLSSYLLPDLKQMNTEAHFLSLIIICPTCSWRGSVALVPIPCLPWQGMGTTLSKVLSKKLSTVNMLI